MLGVPPAHEHVEIVVVLVVLLDVKVGVLADVVVVLVVVVLVDVRVGLPVDVVVVLVVVGVGGVGHGPVRGRQNRLIVSMSGFEPFAAAKTRKG